MKNDDEKPKTEDKDDKQEEVREAAQLENLEVEQLQKQVEELDNKYKRALADYQNLEKRAREERGHWIKQASKETLLRLLPILDTLMQAIKYSEDKALQVATQQFLATLKDEGVERIETVGKQFDPVTMECIVTEAGADGKVLEELRAGYRLHDTVLRPAQVKVGKTS